MHKYSDSPPPHAHQPRLTLSNRKGQSGHSGGLLDYSAVAKDSSEDSPRRGQGLPASGSTLRARYPPELKKLAVAFVFMFTTFVLTCSSLAFVHEDRPLSPPLPDQLLDRIPFQVWTRVLT